MKKIYFLSTCSTCKTIMDTLDLSDFEKIDIKTNPLTPQQLDELKSLSGSYEALFSKRAQLYKKLRLKDQDLKENDFKKYLSEQYTFLQRPVIVDGEQIFIGSSPKTRKALQDKYGR